MGLKDHQIVTHGLPIRPDFAKSHGSVPALRRRLGMDPSLPAVLLVGGGEGMGKLRQTVRAIADRGVRCQLAVICGRNAALRRELAEGDFGDTVVKAFGFVRNMPEFMAASDAIITKAGTPRPPRGAVILEPLGRAACTICVLRACVRRANSSRQGAIHAPGNVWLRGSPLETACWWTQAHQRQG